MMCDSVDFLFTPAGKFFALLVKLPSQPKKCRSKSFQAYKISFLVKTGKGFEKPTVKKYP